MIAQLLLTAMLFAILLYAWRTYRLAPAVGLLAVAAAFAGLYFVWFPTHATALAEFVGIGRGVDLIVYTWVVISLLMLVNLHLKLRAQMEVITALAGIVISLRNSTGAANVAQGLELTAVTAVLLGGVSIFGGRGTILGVILALVLLGAIQKALLLSESISSYWIQIVTGALLVGSVLGPNLARRLTEARRRRSRPHPEEGQ